MPAMPRRTYSVPEHITMAGLGAGLIGAIYPTIMNQTGGRGLPCPLRTLTGVPCPFCGLTTATVALTHNEWAAAASASPLVFLVAALVTVTTPILAARLFGLAPPPRPWSAAARARTRYSAYGVVALSWLFQLHRCHVL
jgi:glycerol-3-phosphate acyltransferase PlsY